jgi:hypothetical protein
MALDPDTFARVMEQTCRFPETRRDVVRYFLNAAESGHNCYFQIGRGLTFNGRACLVHYFEGELYIFPLGHARARRLDIEKMTLDCFQTRPMSHHEIRSMVTLGEVRFLPVAGQDRFVVKLKVLEVCCPTPVDVPFPYPYAVQMVLHGSGPQVTSWAYPSMQPQKNRTVSFELETARFAVGEHPISGSAVVFVSLSSWPQPLDPASGRDEVETIQLSNVVGTIVDFRGVA